MVNDNTKANKGVFTATVSVNRLIGRRFYRLGLKFPAGATEAFANYKPGQFVQIDLSGAALPSAEAIPEELADAAGRKILLRRPFSFADLVIKEGKVSAEILYRVVGPATLRMTTLAAGQSVSIIGPLGNGFGVSKDKKTALLVSGGMGAGPLLHLTKVMTSDYPTIEPIVFAGAKTKDELPFEGRLDKIAQDLGFSIGEFARYGVKSMVATDDGTAGFSGLITDCLYQWLSKHGEAVKDTIIYGCGPEAMLARIAAIAKEKNIDCQISMEQMMACGIGVCQSCAVECKVDESNKTIYKMCCKDGPVFNAREVVFSS